MPVGDPYSPLFDQSARKLICHYENFPGRTGKCGAVLTYGNTMHPSAVTNNSATGKNYTYDNNGNMLNRGIQSMTWNIDNRVASITILGGGTANMEYDYTGQRMIKNATNLGFLLIPYLGELRRKILLVLDYNVEESLSI